MSAPETDKRARRPSQNFYRRDPGSALAGMAGLSLEERGVYNTILDLMYLTWRPVEDARAYLAGHCGCSVQKLNPILRRLIAAGKLERVEEGGRAWLTNPAFERERELVKGARQLGQKSAGLEKNPPVWPEKTPQIQSAESPERFREEKTPPHPQGLVCDEPLSLKNLKNAVSPSKDGAQTNAGEGRRPAKIRLCGLNQSSLGPDLRRDRSGSRPSPGTRGSSGPGSHQDEDPQIPDLPPQGEVPAEPGKGASDPEADEALQAFTLWNALAQRLNLPVAQRLDPRRRRQIERRLRGVRHEPPLNAWRRALAAVEASPFCQGQGPNGWRADLDFLCRANAFARLLEGAYAPAAPAAAASEQSAPDPHAQWRPRLAEWTQNRFWNDLDWGPRPGREGCRVPAELLAEVEAPSSLVPRGRGTARRVVEGAQPPSQPAARRPAQPEKHPPPLRGPPPSHAREE